MPIRLKCTCGKALSLKDEFAGKVIKCPGCTKKLRVPTGKPVAAAASKPAAKSDLDDLFAEEGFDRQVASACPECGKEMEAQSVLCTNCGFNKQSGERMTAHQTDGVDIDMGTVQLNRAAASMERDAALQQRMHSKAGMPWWMLLVVLFVIVSGSGLLVAVIMTRNQVEGAGLSFNATKTFYGLVGGLFAVLGGGGMLNFGWRKFKKIKGGNVSLVIKSLIGLGIGGYLISLAV